YLNSTGMSLEEINILLSHESGLEGLLGRKCAFRDFLEDSDDTEIAKVQHIFRYSILKYLGSFIAILGGVDVIVFVGEEINKAMNFISRLCDELEFPGLNKSSIVEQKSGFVSLTQRKSPVNIFCVECNKWKIISEHVLNILTEGDRNENG
ncbi:MAG: hypothetical protein P9M03_06490, partial [Candidatus Theseobacter exili]|nr:hypothetical protein [Candidatus Theseobacter exili]